MKFLFFFIFSIFINSAFANDCTVESVMNDTVVANCQTFEAGLPLFDSTGAQVTILGNDGNRVAIKNKAGSSFVKGEALNYKTFDPRYPASLDPFDSKFMRVFLSGVRYQYSSLEGDFSSTGIDAEFEIKGGELKTLPLSFDIELLFDHLGVVLSPNFANDSGEISVYSRNDFLNFGLFVSINSKSNERKLTINNSSLMSSDEDASAISAGFLIREDIDFENWQILTDFRLGYFREKSSFRNSGGSESEVTYDAGLASLEFDLFHKVSNRFLAGFGFGVGYGLGTIEVSESTDVLGDETDLFSFQVNLLQLQLVF